MMFSATMPQEVKKTCRAFMQNQDEILIDDETKLVLHGLLQYYLTIEEKEKNQKLTDLLDALEFNQAIIFVKSQARATALNKLLNEQKFPSVCIHGGMDQDTRIKNYQEFKNF